MNGMYAVVIAAACGAAAFLALGSAIIGVIVIAGHEINPEYFPARWIAGFYHSATSAFAIAGGSGLLAGFLWWYANQLWPNKRFTS